MDIHFKELPIVDWEQNLKLAGNNKELASDMLTMLTRHLPEELNCINEQHHRNNDAGLLKSVHKLHGAIAYCGLPRLKAILHSLESNLKHKKLEDVPELIKQLNIEAELALKECKNF